MHKVEICFEDLQTAFLFPQRPNGAAMSTNRPNVHTTVAAFVRKYNNGFTIIHKTVHDSLSHQHVLHSV